MTDTKPKSDCDKFNEKLLELYSNNQLTSLFCLTLINRCLRFVTPYCNDNLIVSNWKKVLPDLVNNPACLWSVTLSCCNDLVNTVNCNPVFVVNYNKFKLGELYLVEALHNSKI